MMGLSKLGTAIKVITAITLTALLVEIIYVLCHHLRFRLRVRVEPQEASLPSLSSSPRELEQQVMKWQCLYGPSRVLFTIKEEEREGLDSENGSSAENIVVKMTNSNRAWLSEGVEMVTVTVTVEELKEATPFSTPCASPSYYTPSSSPSREVERDSNDGGNGCLS